MIITRNNYKQIITCQKETKKSEILIKQLCFFVLLLNLWLVKFEN